MSFVLHPHDVPHELEIAKTSRRAVAQCMAPNVLVEQRAAVLRKPKLLYPGSSTPSNLERSYAARPLQRKLDALTKRQIKRVLSRDNVEFGEPWGIPTPQQLEQAKKEYALCDPEGPAGINSALTFEHADTCGYRSETGKCHQIDKDDLRLLHAQFRAARGANKPGWLPQAAQSVRPYCPEKQAEVDKTMAVGALWSVLEHLT